MAQAKPATARWVRALMQLTKFGPRDPKERARLAELFKGKSIADMRHMWDNLDDSSFYGQYDCADIHSYMNMIGDGRYCAV